jgi:hypothetical protein
VGRLFVALCAFIVLVTSLLCLSVTLAGCATRAPTPYRLSSAGIGVAVISPPVSEIGAVESNLVDASGSSAEAMKKVSLGPLGRAVKSPMRNGIELH